MLILSIHLAARIRGYLAFYMPTNRMVDWLRTPPGLKWAVPAALVMVPTCIFVMSVCDTVVDHGGPGYINLLVMLFAWNALKFVVIGMLSPAMYICSLVRARSVSDYHGMIRSTVS